MPLPAEPPYLRLLSVGLGAGLEEPVLARVLSYCSHETIERGEYLWQAGDVASFFVIIESGMMRLTQATPNGKPVVVELLGCGDCMGLLATIGNTHHPFSALSLTPVNLLKIDSAAWREHCISQPAMLRRAAELIVPRLLNGFGFMACMATASVEARLALSLLLLEELNAREHGVGETLSITRQGLADIGVTTIESAIRVTSRWQKQRVISAGHGRLTILDRARLQSLAMPALPNSSLYASGVFAPVSQTG